MHRDESWGGQVRLAAVLASMGPREIVDGEYAAVTMLHDPDGLVGEVVDHTAVVVPEDVKRRLRGPLNDAAKAQRVALVEVYRGVTFDDSSCLHHLEREEE